MNERRPAKANQWQRQRRQITVSDQGQGIPVTEQDRIFERFYRVDAARSRATGGTGLGLAIVKHVCATHGGDVSVWSRPGAGSTFTIKIPAHLHPAEAAAARDDAPAAVTELPGPGLDPQRQEVR